MHPPMGSAAILVADSHPPGVRASKNQQTPHEKRAVAIKTHSKLSLMLPSHPPGPFSVGIGWVCPPSQIHLQATKAESISDPIKSATKVPSIELEKVWAGWELKILAHETWASISGAFSQPSTLMLQHLLCLSEHVVLLRHIRSFHSCCPPTLLDHFQLASVGSVHPVKSIFRPQRLSPFRTQSNPPLKCPP